MERVENAEEFVEISDEVITEVVWTLESFYAVPRLEIAQHLAGMINFAGIRVSSRKTLLHALQSFAATNADFVDCLLAARASLRKLTVYSFDESDFKKLSCDWKRP
jgi:predicted nucleic-acid-binding protein